MGESERERARANFCLLKCVCACMHTNIVDTVLSICVDLARTEKNIFNRTLVQKASNCQIGTDL